jgi:hypothetical protein
MDWVFWPGHNNPSYAIEVREITEKYFRDNEHLRSRVNDHLRACYEILDLIPQTVENFGSGHFFPFLEAYRELETSLVLAVFGFYRHALTALRAVLELNLIGVYHDRDDKAAKEVQDWLQGHDDKLSFRKMLKGLDSIPSYKLYYTVTDFSDVLSKTYHNLGGFIHVRGFPYSSSRLVSGCRNQFLEKTLKGFIDIFCSVAHCSVVLILLKYPIGVQYLPLEVKFGLNTPAGGFLDADARAAVIKILEPVAEKLLRIISEADPAVQSIVEQIESLPDLSDEG